MIDAIDAVTEPWWSEFWHRLASSPDAVGRAAARYGFVPDARDLAGLGVTRATARTRCARGDWTAAGHGFVAPCRAPSVRHRHALAATAAARRRPDDAIAGRSAAALYALPFMGDPTEPRLVLREPSLGRSRRSGRCYTGWLADEELTSWYGAAVATPARTLVDLARHDRFDAIMAVDAALRLGLVTHHSVTSALERAAGWPGVRQARAVLALGDARSESPLESVTRLRLHDDGFPPAELQYWIGSHRVDFCWPDIRLVLEVDGRVKYTRPDDDEDDPLWSEKKREQAVRAHGYRVERVIASEIFRGWRETSAYLRSLFRPALRVV